MSAEIVNLNKFRKAKERAEHEKQAEANRSKFGRTKEARLREEDEQERRNKLLDGARIAGTEANSETRAHSSHDDDIDPGTVS